MRLPNNLKGVSQSRISKKISVSWRDINHKSSKMVKNNYKREKTPNSNDIQASKAKNRCRLSVGQLLREKYDLILNDEN